MTRHFILTPHPVLELAVTALLRMCLMHATFNYRRAFLYIFIYVCSERYLMYQVVYFGLV